jgi:hypothetical protein
MVKIYRRGGDGPGLNDARIVDEHIEAVVVVDRPLNRGFGLIPPAHIASRYEDLRPITGKVVSGRGERLFAASAERQASAGSHELTS